MQTPSGAHSGEGGILVSDGRGSGPVGIGGLHAELGEAGQENAWVGV